MPLTAEFFDNRQDDAPQEKGLFGRLSDVFNRLTKTMDNQYTLGAAVQRLTGTKIPLSAPFGKAARIVERTTTVVLGSTCIAMAVATQTPAPLLLLPRAKELGIVFGALTDWSLMLCGDLADSLDRRFVFQRRLPSQP